MICDKCKQDLLCPIIIFEPIKIENNRITNSKVRCLRCYIAWQQIHWFVNQKLLS